MDTKITNLKYAKSMYDIIGAYCDLSEVALETAFEETVSTKHYKHSFYTLGISGKNIGQAFSIVPPNRWEIISIDPRLDSDEWYLEAYYTENFDLDEKGNEERYLIYSLGA